MELVYFWRSLNPPGRFLARTNPERADSLWREVGDDLARKRASKTLGERSRKWPRGASPKAKDDTKHPSEVMESLDGVFNTSVGGDENGFFRNTDTPIGSSMPLDGSRISAQRALLQETLHPAIPASSRHQQGVEENQRRIESEIDSEGWPQGVYLSQVQALSQSSASIPDFSLINVESMFASSLKWMLPTAASLAGSVFSSSDDNESLDNETLSTENCQRSRKGFE